MKNYNRVFIDTKLRCQRNQNTDNHLGCKFDVDVSFEFKDANKSHSTIN